MQLNSINHRDHARNGNDDEGEYFNNVAKSMNKSSNKNIADVFAVVRR